MITTRKSVAGKITAYLKHRISLRDLVDWAEEVMKDGAVDPLHAEEITEAVSRLGVADVREFGLTWEDCEKMLRKLGYAVNIDVKVVA